MAKYPILYAPDATDFFNMGLGPLTTSLTATVSEERNGSFILEAEVLTDDVIYPLLEHNAILKADAGHNLKDQRFRIKRIVPTEEGKATIYAEHVSYLSQELSLKPEITIKSLNANAAIGRWKSSLNETNPFVVDSDITTTGSTKWRIDKVANPRQALGGVEGSLLDIYGGEYRFDNYHISLLKKRGTTANTVLAYGRNITSFEQELNITDTYTSVYPYAVYTDDNETEHIVTIDGYVVDCENISAFPNRVVKIVDFSNEFDHDTVPTKAKLKTLAEQYVTANDFGTPKVSIKVSFVDLSKTADYAEYQALEEVNLCDDVRVIFPKLGVNTVAKVTRTVWNVLSESYDEIEIGEKRASLSTIINDQGKQIGEAEKNANGALTAANGKNTIFYGLYGENGLGEPVANKIGDTWYKPNGEDTETYIWNGTIWEFVASTASDQALIELIEENKRLVEEAQAAAEDAQKVGEDAQKVADEAKKTGEEAKAAGETAQAAADEASKKANDAAIDAGNALNKANDAVSTATDASAKVDQSQQTADQAKSDATNAVSNANQAKDNAQDALDKAGQADATANQAKSDATTAVNTANEAKSSAGTALTNANQAIADATDALNQSALAKSQAEEAVEKYLGMGMVPAWSWSQDGTDRFTTEYPGDNYVLKSKEPYTATGNGGSNQYPASINSIPLNPDILGKAATIQYKLTISNYESGSVVDLKLYKAVGVWSSFGNKVNISGNGTWLIRWKGNLPPLKENGEPKADFNTNLKAEILIEELRFNEGTEYQIYRPSPSEDYANAVPSYIGFAIEPSDNPADYTWIRNPEKVEGEVKVELTEINGELKRKVSQETFDQLNSTVINHSTLISQNQNAIKLKADHSTVDTINQTVADHSTAIDLNAEAIALKANQSTVDSLTGRVTTAEGSIDVLAGQVALKANKTDVDTIAGRVSSAESQLTVQAGKITGLSTLTDGHTTQIGSLQSGYDGLSSTVSKVESDLSGLSVGGRNYVLNTADGFRATGNGNSNQYPASINSIPFNPDILGKEATIQYKLTISNYESGSSVGLKLYDAVGVWLTYGGKTDISGNGTWLIKWKGTLLPLKDGGRPEIRFNTDLGADILIEELRINAGNLYQDWEPAPEDQATASEMSSLTQTVDSISATVTANKTEADGKFSSQQTAINANTNSIKLKANQSTVDTLTGRVSTAEGSIDVLSGQVALKANQSTVDTLTNTVNAHSSELTVQAGKITGLTSVTDGHTTKIGALELQAGQFSLSLSSVQNDLNGLQIGGRNYFSVNAWKIKPPLSAATVPYIEIQLEPSTEYTIATNIPVNSNGSTRDVFIFKGTDVPSSASNGVAKNQPRTIKTNDDGLIKVAERMYDLTTGAWWIMLSKGNKALDWTPAPEDMATVTEMSNLTQTVNTIQSTVANKANQSQVTQLANQITSVVSDISAIDKTLNWQKLSVSQDFNLLKTTGRFFIAAVGNTNAPLADRWCYLTVDNTNGRIKQEYQDDYDVTGKYFRISSDAGSTWKAWQRVANQSQITQLSDAINLRVVKDDIINQININDQGVLIAGEKVHITGQTTIDNAVIKTANIVDLAVSEAKIGSLAVSSAKIQELAVTTAKIANLAVSEAKIGDLAVTSAKIKDAAITSAKIGEAAIGTAHIGDGVITNAKIGFLSADKINTGTLDAATVNVINLNANNITTGKLDASLVNVANLNATNITSGTLNAARIGAGAITADKIASNAITADKISAGAITASKIASKAITADKLNVTELSALSSDLGTVTAARIENDYFELQAYGGVQPRIILKTIPSSLNPQYGVKLNPQDIKFYSESSTATQGISRVSGGLLISNSDKENDTGILLSVASATTITVKRNQTTITGSLNVTASKNAIHPTRDGVRATPAYELAESYLGDIDRSYTDGNCTAVVPIEALFSDTVNLDIPYEVFLQAYDDAHFWVSDFTSTYFVVKSNKPMARFAWELKAKRRGFENERLVLNDSFDNNLIEETWR